MNENIEAGWKIPGIMKGINPQAAYDEIFGDGGNHTASEIVEMARKKSSSMHNYFEWNNGIASEEFRKIQAQRLLRNFIIIKVEPKTQEKTKTSFRMVEATSERKSEYAPIKFFMQNRSEYEDLLNRAKMELENFRNRYSHIVELDSIIREIDILLTV